MTEAQFVDQRSPEWFAARLGKVTASRVSDVIAKTKTGYSTSRDNYMAQLICERMTGTQAESFTNAAMAWGTETEPLARAAYEAKKDVLVDEVGLITHPYISMAGASPDGVVGDDGVLEIKCPNTATHFETLLKGEMPSKYIPQVQWQMACTSRKWCDFVSFDPRVDDGLKLFVIRINRDSEYIKMLEDEVMKFLRELEIKLNKLNDLKGKL
jgi:putative phage-type endonuclease